MSDTCYVYELYSMNEGSLFQALRPGPLLVIWTNFIPGIDKKLRLLKVYGDIR